MHLQKYRDRTNKGNGNNNTGYHGYNNYNNGHKKWDNEEKTDGEHKTSYRDQKKNYN